MNTIISLLLEGFYKLGSYSLANTSLAGHHQTDIRMLKKMRRLSRR